MDGLEWIGQESFAAGVFPLQERVPAAAVEDCVNGLYGEDGSIFKRGGGVYKGTAAAASLMGIHDLQLVGGQRTILVAADGKTLYQFAGDDATPTAFDSAGVAFWKMRRAAVMGGVAIFPTVDTDRAYTIFGGARVGGYLTGTVDVTEDSATVTGHGTSWLGNVEAGSLFITSFGPGAARVIAVKSVESNTSLTLARPWDFATGSGAYITYKALDPVATPIPIASTASAPYVGSAANRLFVGQGPLIYFTPINEYTRIAVTDFHALPTGGVVSGLQGLAERVLVFSTAGVYAIENAAYDLTDALGNVQQQLVPLSDLVLWHDNGIANWHGAVVVPAVDNVYLLDAGGASVPIGDPVRKLYRSYVAAGYTLGLATVVQGHYVVPVLNGTTWVDTLVCRLDTRAWGRMSGHSGSCISFATRVAADATRTQKLLGVNGTRIVDATGWFAPVAGNKAEADSTQHNLQVTLRTVQRKTSKDQLMKFRVRYELDDAASDNPTITGEVAVGRPGSSFTTLSGSGAENVGQTPKVWTKIGKRGQEFRVRLTSVGPSSALVLRSVEYGFRPSGRQ